MKNLGDFTAGKTIICRFNTHKADGTPITLAGTPAVSVYNNSTTQSTTGVTLTVDYDSVTGLHHVAVDTSANSSFFAEGNDFDIVITAGTVDSISVVGTVVGTFSLANRSALRPTTADRTLLVASDGKTTDANSHSAADVLTAFAGTRAVLPNLVNTIGDILPASLVLSIDSNTTPLYLVNGSYSSSDVNTNQAPYVQWDGTDWVITLADASVYKTSAVNLSEIWTAISYGYISGATSGSVITTTCLYANATSSAQSGDSMNLADGAITAAKIASNAITSAKIATDAIGAAQLAADAVSEIAAAVWAATISSVSGVATTMGGAVAQTWRRFFKKATKSATQIQTFADDGTTPITTQAISVSGDDETQGAAT